MKLIKELLPYIVIIICVILIRSFIITPVRVDGDSMYPTLKNGEILLLEKFDTKYQRNDIVVIDYKDERLIKRVIAMPGETIEYSDNALYINNKIVKDVVTNITDDFDKVTLKDDEYFVMGDNRQVSKDSRSIGVINKKNIVGKTKIRIFPLDKISTFK